MSDFTPDIPTCKWLIDEMLRAAEQHERISAILTSGTDRAVRKGLTAQSLSLVMFLRDVIKLVESGKWGEDGKQAGEAQEALPDDGKVDQVGGEVKV